MKSLKLSAVILAVLVATTARADYETVIIQGAENIECTYANGNDTMQTTLAAAAAFFNDSNMDYYDGAKGTLVRIQVTTPTFQNDSLVLIEGTTNYDGVKYIKRAAGGYIYIRSPYVAETFTTADTAKIAIAPSLKFAGYAKNTPVTDPFILRSVDMKINTAPTTSENFTLTRDDNKGALHDTVILTKDFSVGSVTSYFKAYGDDDPIYFHEGDLLRAAWANTDGRTWALQMCYQRLNK